MSANQKFRVTASALNLRSQPSVKPGNRITSLPNGQIVTKIGEAADNRWWRISTTFHHNDLEGFIASEFLTPVSDFVEPPSQSEISAVHLPTNGQLIRRSKTSGRAHPLTEAGQPARTGDTASQRKTEIGRIIEWLNVAQNARYLPGGGKTFCNIYAYDYCYLAQVYLPRVWWSSSAIVKLASGNSVSPQYGVTVSELNANSLFNWFEEFGGRFGWTRTFDLTDLQDAANEGKVCIISAQRVDLNRSGHICPVVPETSNHKATRNGNRVTIPLQSQAGATNFNYGGKVWWTSSQFRSFGFWKHE